MTAATASPTPRSLGFRPPAEWDPHRAVWLAWPSHLALWGDALASVRASFVGLCEAVADVDPSHGRARGEQLEVLVLPGESEASCRRALAHLPARLHRVPFGDIWLRDTAPIFVASRGGEVAAVRFAFNGWGGRYVLEGDAEVARNVAHSAGRRTFAFPFVLEGGSIESDGDGTFLTTRQCLLNPNRNPTMDAGAVEATLAESLGAERVLWLDEGLANDHTDGHVDTLARFVRPGEVVCMEPSGSGDPNAQVLETVARALASFRDARERRLGVHTVPSPGRVEGPDGALLPASYVNFYVGNRSVVVPTYGVATDGTAVEAIGRLFPGRRIVGVRAREMVGGGGAFHCITQPEPLSADDGGRVG